MNAIGFVSPWLLAGLAVLPVVWWLLRITPPAARLQEFPAIALLFGLDATETTAARTPWWLLLLRLIATALAIIGLAGPVRHLPRPTAAAGPLLLVIDNGWAAAADWSDRLRAAQAAVDVAAPATAQMQMLMTAPPAEGGPPALGPSMRVADLAARLAVAAPMAWRPDRGAAAVAIAAAPAEARVIYLADGIAGDTAGDARFAAALARFAGVTELRGERAPRLLRPAQPRADQLVLQAQTLPGHAGAARVRALDAAGATLAETDLTFAADGTGSGALVLPPDLRNRVASLRTAGEASAGSVLLLDEGSKRRPVGLLSHGGAEDSPLTGMLFYLRRALAERAELRTGDAAGLISGGVSVIIAADQVITDPAEQTALAGWVRRGGVLVRFAGPAVAAAAAADPLLPVALLAGDRSLGGAMSWSRPASLAPFPTESPFAGLAIPDDVRVSRQVLAQPGDAPDPQGLHPGPRQDWAALADGTPLVTAAALGSGRLVLFHVTANAAWSNLPLSGLFPQMLGRLVALSAGIKPHLDAAPLAPRRALDGYGALGTPGDAAVAIAGADLAATIAGPRHPPGLYGPDDSVRAFNLGDAEPALHPAPPVPGAIVSGFSGVAAPQPFGPALLAAATVLLAADLVIALGLRGLLGAAAACLLLIMPPAGAQDIPPMPSLATHLAYVVTGDAQADGISRAGLKGLSQYVNARTSAEIDTVVGVDPRQDDLSYYPLLYWPILADAAPPDGATVAKLDDYMENGGIIVFDTRDGGAPDAAVQAAFRRIGASLSIPPLAALTPQHVLSHSFYLLHDWPGRVEGGTVFVDSLADPGNDGVSPVIIGGGDWAAAWAVDDSGGNPYECVPGGEDQRVTAYRFGVNLVIYALTGNYKGDQVHVPELLRRMGQPPDAAPDTPPDGAP